MYIVQGTRYIMYARCRLDCIYIIVYTYRAICVHRTRYKVQYVRYDVLVRCVRVYTMYLYKYIVQDSSILVPCVRCTSGSLYIHRTCTSYEYLVWRAFQRVAFADTCNSIPTQTHQIASASLHSQRDNLAAALLLRSRTPAPVVS